MNITIIAICALVLSVFNTFAIWFILDSIELRQKILIEMLDRKVKECVKAKA